MKRIIPRLPGETLSYMSDSESDKISFKLASAVRAFSEPFELRHLLPGAYEWDLNDGGMDALDSPEVVPDTTTLSIENTDATITLTSDTAVEAGEFVTLGFSAVDATQETIAGDTAFTGNRTVNDVSPTIAITGAPAGTPVTLTARLSGADAENTFTHAWSVSKESATLETSETRHSASPADDKGQYVVSLTVSDNVGGSISLDPQTLTVSGAAPVEEIIGPQDLAIEEAASDRNSVNAAAGSQIDWIVTPHGDEFSAPITSLEDTTLSFGVAVTEAGSADVDAGFDDEDSQLVTFGKDRNTTDDSFNFTPADKDVDSYTVAPVNGTISDAPPTPQEGTQIGVTGSTTGKAAGFHFTPTHDGSYLVSLVVTDDDGRAVGAVTKTITVADVSPAGHIIAFAGAGMDTITVDPSVEISAVLCGGNGKDNLIDDGGHDLPTGRRGTDLPAGSEDRDIHTAAEADSLDRCNDDILVSRTTAGARSFSATVAIQAEWARQDLIFADPVQQVKSRWLAGRAAVIS